MMTNTRERASTICASEGKLLVVWLKDPVSGRVRPFPPGGAIEAGESPQSAAFRETLEETGYSVMIDVSRSKVVDYPFEWAGRLFQCRTHFFRAELNLEVARVSPQRDPILVKVGWLEENRLRAELKFHQVIYETIIHLL